MVEDWESRRPHQVPLNPFQYQNSCQALTTLRFFLFCFSWTVVVFSSKELPGRLAVYVHVARLLVASVWLVSSFWMTLSDKTLLSVLFSLEPYQLFV